MDEHTVRAIVREAVNRHLGVSIAAQEPGRRFLVHPAHASHARYLLPGSGGPCLIEPAVQCNHCGYCESHGH